MDQLLHIALVTQDHFRAEAIAAITSSVGWRLEANVGQNQPLAWLRRAQAEVILVDLDIPNAIALLREVAGILPHAILLALVTPQHLVELQEALLAGAAGFVAFPVDAPQFTATVLRTVQAAPVREKKAKRGRLVAVVGLKGGVGRTTVAVNMTVALRQRVDKEVVLVEAHHSLSDLSLMLNLLPRHTIANLAQEHNIDLDVIQGLLQSHASRIKVLAAPQDITDLVELPVESWRQILTLLLESTAYVVVDTGPVGDAVLSEVLTMADDIVVVTGPDLAGLRSAVVLLKALDAEEEIHARTHVVLNRAGVRGGVDESACAKQLGEPIAAALPDDPALATFALNRGVPFVLSHPRAILSRKVQELAEKVFELRAGDVTRRNELRLPFGKNKARTVQQAVAA